MEPKDRLKEARMKAGFDSPTDASRSLRDINQNTLISHENGNRDISRKAAEKYGQAFGVDPGWILYGDMGDDKNPDIVEVPLLSGISAGNLRDQNGISPSDIQKWIKVADLPKGNWVALTVEGDSMDRIAPDGSIILVNRSDDKLIDGKYYVFSVDGGAATFKKYKRTPERLQPYSTNPDHTSISGNSEFHVFGRVRRIINDV